MKKNARREFLKNGLLAAGSTWVMNSFESTAAPGQPGTGSIRVDRVNSDFEREKLVRPFGFKGGYMTEMWQTACQLQSGSGHKKIGLCTQNVLYADANVFASCSEAVGNALMFSLTNRALQLVRETAFTTPIDLLEKILPEVLTYGRKLTGRGDLNPIFALNALIGVDNAAWLLYAAENGLKDFGAMIPPCSSHFNHARLSLPSAKRKLTDPNLVEGAVNHVHKWINGSTTSGKSDSLFRCKGSEDPLHFSDGRLRLGIMSLF